MQIDHSLANRALALVGVDPITWSDRAGDTLRWRTLRDYYLPTFLEALSEVDWTGGRKRKRLRLTGVPHAKTGRSFVYDLPIDCARPLELLDNAYFVVEDRFLSTEQDRAELLYITNGKTLRPVFFVSAGRPGNIPEAEYLSAGRPWDVSEATLRAGRPGDAPEAVPGSPPPSEDPVFDEDYPEYRPPRYEPKFYEYLEHALAAKLCVLLTKNISLHNQLLQEAMVIRQEAVVASMGASAAKLRPQTWWKEELGLEC
jgi:hypothetical protein